MQKSNEPEVQEKEDRDDILIPCWLEDETMENCEKTVNWSKTNEFMYTSEVIVKRLYLLAHVIQKCFDALDIFYWACGGTLLGCVRHQGLIPWDDDLDFCVYKKDESKITSLLRPLLMENGCDLMDVPTFGYRVYHKTEPQCLGEYQHRRYPFCDIFIMRRKARISSIAAGSGRTMWPEEYYKNSDIGKTEKKLFGDIQLNCPANADEYLCRTYGENWFEEGATHNYDHVTQQFVRSVKFKLQKEDYEPARPFK